MNTYRSNFFFSIYQRELQKVKSQQRLDERDRKQKKNNEETEQEQKTISNIAKVFVAWICLSLVHAAWTLMSVTQAKNIQEGKILSSKNLQIMVYLVNLFLIKIFDFHSCEYMNQSFGGPFYESKQQKILFRI